MDVSVPTEARECADHSVTTEARARADDSVATEARARPDDSVATEARAHADDSVTLTHISAYSITLCIFVEGRGRRKDEAEDPKRNFNIYQKMKLFILSTHCRFHEY